MREIRTSGLASGDWKRGGILIVHQPATAPVIDSTGQLDPALLALPLQSVRVKCRLTSC